MRVTLGLFVGAGRTAEIAPAPTATGTSVFHHTAPIECTPKAPLASPIATSAANVPLSPHVTAQTEPSLAIEAFGQLASCVAFERAVTAPHVPVAGMMRFEILP